MKRSFVLAFAGALATLALAIPPTAAAVAGELPATGTMRSVSAEATDEHHDITFDGGSLKIDGQRLVVWSGEFHYWRSPNQSLWLDTFQKMKANGYNAVSIYFDWAFHSPAQGVYDFTGIRDVDALLDMAEEAGLYVIARPGPYVNAETQGGGFPDWMIDVPGKARTDAPDYLAAVDEWMTQIDAILARHQLTDGSGSVILDQIENELASTGTTQKNYMQHLYDTVRADGIDVPIFHNDKGRNGIWVPEGSNVPGTVEGPVDMYAFDGYASGSCSTNGSVGSPSAAPDWGIFGTGGATGGATASPNTPGFGAEIGGGWFDYWGSWGSYECTAQRTGPGMERVFYGNYLANGLSIQNYYMTIGGTNWGWLAAPVVYTSYDYGAAISEARQIRPKATAMKLLGNFVQSVPEVSNLERSTDVTPSSSKVKVLHTQDPESGTDFFFTVHNPSNGTTNDAFTFPITTDDGNYTVPQSGTVRLNGQDAKTLVADYDLDGQHLVYSTSEIMTHFAREDADTVLLHGRDGEDGETVLRYASEPTVTVLSGSVTSTFDAAKGDLRLDYVHDGLAEVRISGGGRPDLTLLLADTTTAGEFWVQTTPAGVVLERGPELVRTATIDSSTLALTGDTADAVDLQVWAPAGVTAVTWNGADVATTAGLSGDLRSTSQLAGVDEVSLPDLTQATWATAPGSPESDPSFDDTDWTAATETTTTSTTKPPTGAPVLTADDYGFHQGDVWYRGTYTGSADASQLAMYYGAGGAGLLQVWLDGVYLGQNVLATGTSAPPTTGTAKFTIPEQLRAGKHTLAVMVRNNGHNQDGGVNDAQKEGRGLISTTMSGAKGTVATPISWKVQGTLGGEDVVDTARGSNNVGGQYGERSGWYLPGFPDDDWATATLPSEGAMPGTTWYRTSFALDIPDTTDASLGLTIGDASKPQGTGNYRALIYLNGWNVGQYIANVGPQHTFVLPNGILDPQGENTLAIEVTSDGGPGNGLEQIVLADLGTVRGGVDLTLNDAPDWSASVYGDGDVVDQVSVDHLTSDASDTSKGGDVIHVTGTVANRGATEADVTAKLGVPTGWKVVPSAATAIADLAPGASAPVAWTVTVPTTVTAADYEVVATAEWQADGTTRTSGNTLTFPVRFAGDTFVSDMDWVSSVSGWGTIGRDVSVNGAPLTMNGVTYPKGIGVNAISTVVVDLPEQCTSFTSTVGLDVGSANKGSVTFTVIGDGTTLLTTPTIAGTNPPRDIQVDITGVKRLTLTVGDGGNGNGHDNADWGNAEIHCATDEPIVPTVATVAPAAGPAAGGNAVTLTGTGFTAESTVSVDGSDAIAVADVASDGTSLRFTAPEHAAGRVEVTVATGAATSAPAVYTYLPVPTIAGATPNHGPVDGGTVVTLSGTGFTAESTVSVDGSDPIVPTSVDSDVNSDSTTLVFDAPAHDAGTVEVAVTTAGGTSDPVAFTYEAPATAPGAPDAPTAVAAGDTSITVTWSEPGDDGRSPITGYVVYEAGVPEPVCEVSDSVTTCTVTGLELGSTHGYEVAAINAVGEGARSASSTPVTLPDVPSDDGAIAVPAPGVLSSDNGWDTGLQDGAFRITWNNWWGENASVFQLYQDGTLVSKQYLDADGRRAQKATVDIAGLGNGEHKYVAVLKNSKGRTQSMALTVSVTDANPGKPVLSSDNWDRDGDYTVTADLWWGTNATAYRFLEDGVEIGAGNLTAATPKAQRATVHVTDRPIGTHTYTVEFRNQAGATTSAPLTVAVSK